MLYLSELRPVTIGTLRHSSSITLSTILVQRCWRTRLPSESINILREIDGVKGGPERITGL